MIYNLILENETGPQIDLFKTASYAGMDTEKFHVTTTV